MRACVKLALTGALSLAGSFAHAMPMERAILQGLDKTTARVSRIVVPVGESVTFGSLTIEAEACDKRPPEETPEAAAFLKIVEQRPDEAPVERFSGWMFASSPALSAMEHPVYDIWVLDCASGPEALPPADATPSEEPAADQPPVDTLD